MILLNLLAFFAVLIGTWMWIRLAGQRVLQDIPGPRSSHSQPTVRGGGVIFISIFLCLTWLQRNHTENAQFAEPYYVAVAVMMIVGLIDDWRGVSALNRLCIQFITATLLTLHTSAAEAQSVLFIAAAILAAVWLINVYNFMDGIDGIAAIQAITVSLSMAAVLFMQHQDQNAWLLVGLAASVAGFLYWNFPVCRIFMGDSGSAALGTIFVIFIILTTQVSADLIWYWLILMAVFIVDASWTLLVRLVTGQKVWTAHNLHAYQKLSRRWHSHKKVSLLVAGYNIFWLAPMLIALELKALSVLVAIVLAWIPMLILCFTLRAGQLPSGTAVKQK